MTYPVTVYRWDDPGAPQITTTYGTANELKAVLDACLVTGYGSKASLGWTKVFDDANGVVYQNNVAAGGSGSMVRLRPKSGNWSTASSAFASCLELQSAKTYTNSNTPVKASQPWPFYHPSTTGTRAWVIIGTAIGFYLFLNWVDETKTSSSASYKMTTSTYNPSVYVGDLLSLLAGDAYKFAVIGNEASNASGPTSVQNAITLNSAGSISPGTTTGVLLYDMDGGAGTSLYSMKLPFFEYGSAVSSAGQAEPVLICPVPLVNASNGTESNDQSAKQPYCRGFMPGLVNSLFGDGGANTYWPYSRVIAGANYWLVSRASSTVSSKLWINMVEW